MSFGSMLFVLLDDLDSEAFARAFEIAGRMGARITLAGVVEQPSPDLLRGSDLAPERLEQIALAAERDALEELQRHAGAGPRVAVRTLQGALA
ncbi:MAG TPA: universal stress protein, partial [Myxococcota bacterium]|nr:universal stress protein [Myxococcota bacterium]